MDQNQNNNDLFDYGKSPSTPQGSDSTPPAGSARVYNTPESAQPEPAPYSAAPGGSRIYETPSETPPYVPPPPTYTAPGSQPPASPSFWQSNKNWLIAVIIILILCCCCLILIPVVLWFTGDSLIEWMEFNALPLVQLI